MVEVELHKKGKRKKVLSLRLLTVQCSPFVGYFYGSVILSLSVSIHSYPAGRQKIDIIPPRKQHCTEEEGLIPIINSYYLLLL